MTSPAIRQIERCVAAAARSRAQPMVLAVSGGIDSMVLLDAASRVARDAVAIVATFDHGSGRAASRAAELVCDEAGARGLPAVVGHGGTIAQVEAAWRDARREFLRSVATRVSGVVVTAHTEDDQVETVIMRAMRGAGARGLAGLYATGPDVQRPLVGVRRAQVDEYAGARGLRWLADPTNTSRRYLRNRVRHELLPALMQADPKIERELLVIARRAAEWRAEVEALVETIATDAPQGGGSSALSVAVADVADYDAQSLAVLWPALAARLGLALDWRGTRRLVAFTTSRGRVGASIQLSGGWEVVRDRAHWTLRRMRPEAPPPSGLPVDGELRWGRWSFVRDERAVGRSPWRAVLPDDEPLFVRAWRAGDRMAGLAGQARRVKRFFADAGIIAPNRTGWPVVLAGEEIVWIPGVGRGAAVTRAVRTSGVTYSCELDDR